MLMDSRILASGTLEVVGRSSGPLSEEEMCVAITRAWWRLGSREERREHPLGPYVLGPGFVRSVAHAPVGGLLVAGVCAKLASWYPWERDSGEPMPLLGHPLASLDSLTRWWRALGGQCDFGVYYDELASGTLEFQSVGGWRDPLGWGSAYR